MRRGAIAALGLALVLSLGAFSRAAEPGDDTPPDAAKSSGNWFTRLFGGGKKGPSPEEAAKVRKEEAEHSKKAARASAAAERSREEAALFRRQSVCLKLRAIAAQNNDDDLRRQADLLDERAWSIYLRRTAHLSDGSALDEATLERHLGSGTRNASGCSPDTGSRTASRGE
jgi:hypothetical protein